MTEVASHRGSCGGGPDRTSVVLPRHAPGGLPPPRRHPVDNRATHASALGTIPMIHDWAARPQASQLLPTHTHSGATGAAVGAVDAVGGVGAVVGCVVSVILIGSLL